jgi:hypothetical protein
MSPNGTASQYAVNILDGTNYNLWKNRLTSLLQSKGFYKFITSRASELREAFNDHAEKLDLFLEGDEKALGHIKCNISPSYFDVVMECETAFEAWKKLESFFAGKETFNKIHLLEQLIEGKMKETNNPTDDVQEFMREKSELVRRLAAMGLTISEELHVAIVLAKLPDSYDTMRRILESQNELTVLKLAAELNREATRRSKRRPVERIFVAQDSRINNHKRFKIERKKPFCSFCNINGHDNEKCWLNPKSSSYRSDFHQKLLRGLKESEKNQQ